MAWTTSEGGLRGGFVHGNIETLASGSLRVRAFAGTDVQDLYLKQTVPASSRARRRAREVLDKLVQQVRRRALRPCPD